MRELIEMIKGSLEKSKLFERFTVDKVSVDIFTEEEGIKLESSDIEINFDFDIEYRSWGIKDIFPIFDSKLLTIYCQETDEKTLQEKEREIEVDLSTSKIDWVSGRVYSLDRLEVYLDKTGKVKESVIIMTYICYE